MTSEYKRLAYGVAFFAAARRAMEEKYLQGGGALKEDLICELLPFGDRVVPHDAIVESMQRLQEEELRLLNELQTYEFRKRDARPPIPQVKSQEAPQPAIAKPGRKTRRS